MEVIFEMPSGALIVFGIYEASGGETLPWGEIELRGTQGECLRRSDRIQDRALKAGAVPGLESLVEASERKQTVEEVNMANEVITANVVRNFLDCVKSRRNRLARSRKATAPPVSPIWPTSRLR